MDVRRDTRGLARSTTLTRPIKVAPTLKTLPPGDYVAVATVTSSVSASGGDNVRDLVCELHSPRAARSSCSVARRRKSTARS